MADPLAAIAVIVALVSKPVKANQELQHPRDTLNSSQVRNDSRKAEVVLEVDRQKFQVWRRLGYRTFRILS